MADDERSGLIFDSVVWRGDHMIEISYSEERDRGDGCCIVRTLIIPHQKLPNHYRALIDALVDFLEEGEVAVRNPPAQIGRHQENRT